MGVRQPPTLETMKIKKMMCGVGDAGIWFSAQPGADQKHRGPGGPEEVGGECANREKDEVGERRGLALDIDVNAARHDKQRTHQRDEADALSRASTVCQTRSGFPNNQKIIDKNDASQPIDDFRIIPAPPV